MAAPGALPAGLAIPLIDHRRILDLGYESKTYFDYGHIETAWYNLGLEARPAVPTQAQFEDYCIRLIRHVGLIPATKPHSTPRRYRMIVMAIRTISHHYRPDMNPNKPHINFPSPADMPRGQTFAARMADIPVGSRPPLPRAVIDSMTSNAFDQRAARRLRKLQHRQTQFCSVPSDRERAVVFNRIRDAEWETASRYTIFTAFDGTGTLQPLYPITTNKESDNSLWHALSYQINGHGRRDPGCKRLGLRGGRREKAWLYHYFTQVLHDPTHVRHRMYTCMQETSRSTLAPTDGYDQQTTYQMLDWGELSILRCLTVNNPDGGPPKWPQFPAIFQLIADFWRQEVIVFEGEKGMRGPASGWGMPYKMRVFGKRAYGASPLYADAITKTTGQLFFVTDDTWQHFDALQFARETLFSTDHINEDARYSPFNMRFLDIPGFVQPVSRAPVDIPATNNGIPPGGLGHVAYNRPADDPAFRLPNDHPLVVWYENDRDGIEYRNGFGGGRMPKLANMQTMDAWRTERAPAGMPDSRPTSFYPWLMTSGCYKTREDPYITWQGKYENIKAKLIDEWLPWFEGKEIARPFRVPRW